MRIKVVRSKNAASYYVMKSIYENGKHSTKIVEKLGTERSIRESHPDQDPLAWAKAYAAELTRKEKEGKRDVLAHYSTAKRIPSDRQVTYKGGYLFLQAIYYQLGLHKICQAIQSKHDFDYDLNEILSKLLYTRILEPGSKRAACEAAKQDLEAANFDLHQVYRALQTLAKENDFIQAMVYKNSRKVLTRNSKILYYDCTNYFFEIEAEDGIKQYGYSKENRPNPIVQMGLFLDGDGLPLAFSLFPGAMNEQASLKPLEKKVLKDFPLSQVIISSDAGLGSLDNRLFNNANDRAFVVTQSLKKLKKHLKAWALDPTGWQRQGSKTTFDLRQIDTKSPSEWERTYYKSRWINENGLEQQLVVSFSLKYQAYLREVRARQIERAERKIACPSSLKQKKANDPKRFIKTIACTTDGEIAEQNVFYLDQDTIAKEETFDGFYAVCTNLDETPAEILKINHQRWEIEAAFRTMKHELKARPVYLQREDRIQAHFITCFLALLIYKILEKRMREILSGSEISGEKIVRTLKEMNFYKLKGEGYIPAYTRNKITDALHEQFEFHTDFEIVTIASMRKILSKTKK